MFKFVLTFSTTSLEFRVDREFYVRGYYIRVTDRRVADISGDSRAHRIDQGYKCTRIWERGEAKEEGCEGGIQGEEEEGREGGRGARRVRVTRKGGDLTLNLVQVIHLHLEFRLRAYM